MKTFRCNDADCCIEFQAERSAPCPNCGSLDTSPLQSEESPQRDAEAQIEAISQQPGEDVFDILKELCFVAYENPYMGKEWMEGINRAKERLSPYLNAAIGK